ncbi:hypothetical protein [Nocardioides gansuensis]|uniref:hypothetical protein n=1 Tax=Nocardioides gansuensis TaxID=2138300 RepID=UPI0014028949|nr:hypothetical protein [Nocardioides gansuensis]
MDGRGRRLRRRNRSLGIGAGFAGELEFDRRLVDALVSGQLVRVQLEPAFPGCLQPGLPRPVPTGLRP